MKYSLSIQTMIYDIIMMFLNPENSLVFFWFFYKVCLSWKVEKLKPSFRWSQKWMLLNGLFTSWTIWFELGNPSNNYLNSFGLNILGFKFSQVNLVLFKFQIFFIICSKEIWVWDSQTKANHCRLLIRSSQIE